MVYEELKKLEGLSKLEEEDLENIKDLLEYAQSKKEDSFFKRVCAFMGDSYKDEEKYWEACTLEQKREAILTSLQLAGSTIASVVLCIFGELYHDSLISKAAQSYQVKKSKESQAAFLRVCENIQKEYEKNMSNYNDNAFRKARHMYQDTYNCSYPMSQNEKDRIYQELEK